MGIKEHIDVCSHWRTGLDLEIYTILHIWVITKSFTNVHLSIIFRASSFFNLLILGKAPTVLDGFSLIPFDWIDYSNMFIPILFMDFFLFLSDDSNYNDLSFLMYVFVWSEK